MVVLNRIYTKTGDDGTTALGSGERRLKSDLRVDAYGTVDETNAAIGIARLHLSNEPDVNAIMNRVQNDLFDLGADLCTPADGRKAEGALRIVEAQVSRLEQEIDAMNAALKPLTSFILPGGMPAAAYLHLARTVCRRAERLICELVDSQPVHGAALKYINRLSDHLFVLARRVNDNGAKDVLWVPGKTR